MPLSRQARGKVQELPGKVLMDKEETHDLLPGLSPTESITFSHHVPIAQNQVLRYRVYDGIGVATETIIATFVRSPLSNIR